MLLLVRNGHVSGEMVVCVDRLRASCIELSSRTPLQCRPLVVVVPKGLCILSLDMNDDLVPLWPLPYLGSALRSMRDGRREGMLPVKKLVVGPRGGSAGPPHGEHRSARPYCRRCAPGLNWPGRSSGADSDPIVLAFGIGVMINRDSRGHSYFIVRERKLGARRRSDTVLVSTINDADQGLADVAFRTPPAPYEKSKSLGSGGSMVARLKLKGIDGRAPPGVEPAA
ncbi:hypothetical protein V6N12_010111 [Hibiscus sabdariffa]|uniref:Uncharacterized protein n=1 Tax=Hibiscus sabdariffa TaxID=183260 RepID=A0ABR2ECQ9_9ROSI